MNKRNKKFVFGGLLLVAIALGLFASISSDNMTYYHTPSEIINQPDKFLNKKIRIMGLIEAGSVTWKPQETQLSFRISEDSPHFLKINYTGSKPDMFKEGQGVVVEGQLTQPGLVVASKLLVKHSEEYKTKEQQNKNSYYQSMAQ